MAAEPPSYTSSDNFKTQYDAGNTTSGATLIPVTTQQVVVVRQKESFSSQIALSCFVIWCCCWPIGLVAFQLATMAQSEGGSTDERSRMKAHNLGIQSTITSIAGIVIGIILLITLLVIQVN